MPGVPGPAAGNKPQAASSKLQATSSKLPVTSQQGNMKIPKQYYSYVHYYYLYSHKRLPKNYVLKWKKYLDDNYQMDKYYSFFTKEEWKRKLMELPEYHKYILNAERQAASHKRQARSSPRTFGATSSETSRK